MEWTRLFKGFFDSEKTGGLLLLLCTLISLAIANSAWGEGYNQFWHHHLDLSFAGLKLNYSIEKWINDGLMTIFFLLVGLEIERELYSGELSGFSNAVLPMVAAVGGMIVPAAIHYMFNSGTPAQNGFGIPMATDIAFALGVLALAGSRVPYAIKIFLTALAIIDDLGAILVIAIFYNSGISWLYLAAAASILAVLLLLGKAKIYNLWFYILSGLGLWYCMMQSGIHPTIAGVLLAFVIPFSGNNETAPSYKLQNFLHKPVGYFIVPLFALANTGIILKAGWIAEVGSYNSIGIIFGLVVGKPVGILLFCRLLVSSTAIRLPKGVAGKNLLGAALLGGIGFTMSIFISNLAFNKAATVNNAKVSVLIGSAIAALSGLAVLFSTRRLPEEKKGTNVVD